MKRIVTTPPRKYLLFIQGYWKSRYTRVTIYKHCTAERYYAVVEKLFWHRTTTQWYSSDTNDFNL